MPVIRSDAIICSVRRHGENGAVVRLLTPDHGLQSGYVRGGRSSALRPVLIPANRVVAELRSRSPDQLAGLTVELAESRAPFMAEPLAAAAFGWVTLLAGEVPAEGQPCPEVFAALDALLGLVCAAPSARWWAQAIVRFELLLLAEQGFALDLTRCAVTGQPGDLVMVSPRTGRAVSRTAAAPHGDRLLVLPPFLLDGSEPDWPQLWQGFALTGHFIERSFFDGRRAALLEARHQLVDRLKRVVA